MCIVGDEECNHSPLPSWSWRCLFIGSHLILLESSSFVMSHSFIESQLVLLQVNVVTGILPPLLASTCVLEILFCLLEMRQMIG